MYFWLYFSLVLFVESCFWFIAESNKRFFVEVSTIEIVQVKTYLDYSSDVFQVSLQFHLNHRLPE